MVCSSNKPNPEANIIIFRHSAVGWVGRFVRSDVNPSAHPTHKSHLACCEPTSNSSSTIHVFASAQMASFDWPPTYIVGRSITLLSHIHQFVVLDFVETYIVFQARNVC